MNIDVVENNITDGGAISLATVMGQNQRCVFIDLSGIYLSPSVCVT